MVIRAECSREAASIIVHTHTSGGKRDITAMTVHGKVRIRNFDKWHMQHCKSASADYAAKSSRSLTSFITMLSTTNAAACLIGILGKFGISVLKPSQKLCAETACHKTAQVFMALGSLVQESSLTCSATCLKLLKFGRPQDNYICSILKRANQAWSIRSW